MRALICDDFGGIEKLRVGELPEPEPGVGEILIAVESVTVNFADVLMVQGLYQFRPATPFAPGYEVAGTVLVANQASGFSPGDRVAGYAFHGAMAEKMVLPMAQAVKIPDGLGSDEASTIPAGYGTSHHALIDRGRLQPDETLLVLGASGGVGLAAVQIGKVIGATVIAAVSSEEKEAAVSAAGADHVIRYDQTDLRTGIKSATGGAVDVVFDPVGGDVTEQALRSTGWNGRLLVIGFAAGDIPKIPINLTLLKGNAIVGVFWGAFTSNEPDKSIANMNTLFQWAAESKIDPLVSKTFPLGAGAEALQWVADRKAVGRVVVNP